jgi:hypothetical protein
MRHSTISALFLAAAVILVPAVYQAASPPAFVNYQGVLRDAADKPLDGSGPGSHTSLAEAFRDYGEVLDPRVRVVAAAYSLNADHIDGFDSVELINTTSASQTKAGPLIVSSREPGEYGLMVYGKEGAYFEAIQEYDPEVHGPADELLGNGPSRRSRQEEQR